MPYSFKEEVSDGVKTVYSLDFGFVSRNDVHVYKGSHAAPVKLAFSWVDDTTIKLTNIASDAPAGTKFWMRRVMDRDALIHVFENKSIRPLTIDQQNYQALYLLQEIADGFTNPDGGNSAQGDLVMGGYRVLQLNTDQNPDDSQAANVAYVKRVAPILAKHWADVAESEADRAQRIADELGIAPSGDYKGLWPDSGGSAEEGDTWQTQASNKPTGQYFAALKDTSVNPVNDGVNWREVVGIATLQNYTHIDYKASGGNSAVENMVAGNPIPAKAGNVCKTRNTTWVCLKDKPLSISDFEVMGDAESSAFFNESPTPLERRSGLVAALSSSDNVIVSKGVYDPFVLSLDNKKLTFEKGHEFRLPDGASSTVETEALRVFEVTGANCELVNELCINGNLTNNSSTSINTSDRRGAFHNASSGLTFGRIKITDANWVGFSQGSIVDAAAQTDGGTVKVINPRGYAVSDWDASGGISRIEVIAGADSQDARVRTGSQTSSPDKKSTTVIGQVITNDTIVIEAHSTDASIGIAVAKSLKFEDCIGCKLGIGTFSGISADAFSFAMLKTKNCSFSTVSVLEHNGSASGACFFSEVEDCNNGTLNVRKSQKGTADITIRSHKNLTFDHISTPSGNLSERGLLVDYDASYAPQEGLVIGSIQSSGHSVLDVELQSNQIVKAQVGYLNSDATANVQSLLNKSNYDEQSFVCELKSTSGLIMLSGSGNQLSFTRIGRSTTVTGRLQVSAVSSPTGTLTLEFLPSPSGDLPDVGGLSAFSVIPGNTATTWGGLMYAQTSEGSSVLTFAGMDGNATFDVANKMQAGTTLAFMFTYFS